MRIEFLTRLRIRAGLGAERLGIYISRAWRWVKENKDPIQICSLVIVALWATYLYFDARATWRIEQSLEFAKEYREGTVSHRRIDLDTFWLQLSDKRWDAASKMGDVKKEMELASIFVKEKHLESKLVGLQTFYKDMAICTEVGKCDSTVNCALFFGDVQTFRDLYFVYFSEWSMKLKSDVGKEIDAFLKVCYRAQARP